VLPAGLRWRHASSQPNLSASPRCAKRCGYVSLAACTV
jgi:hypothetical protein